MRSSRPSLLGRLARLFHVEQWKLVAALMMIYDYGAILFSYFLALWLRFDGRISRIPERYLSAWERFIPVYTVFCILVF